MDIDELLRFPGRREFAAMPEANALEEADALQEADLVDLRLTVGESSVAMLFDLRNALQFRLANTAVLCMREVEHLLWADAPRGPSRRAHYVLASSPSATAGAFTLELICLGGRRVTAVAAAAEFFVGDVPTLSKAPPNFVEDDAETIARGEPDWDSVFKPGWATFVDPLSPRPD